MLYCSSQLVEQNLNVNLNPAEHKKPNNNNKNQQYSLKRILKKRAKWSTHVYSVSVIH